jgi:hypothetical protein
MVWAWSWTVMDPSEITVRKWIVTAGIVCAFLVINLFTPTLMDLPHNRWFFVVAISICVAQINLIATWAALAPGNVMLRLPWSLLLAVLMWYGLVLGNRIENQYFTRGEAILLGLVILFAVIVSQIPLWIAGRAFRWRLVSWVAQAEHSVSGDFQFHLRHVLLGMVFLSLALAPARLVLPAGDSTETLYLDNELWVLLPAVAICNLLITVPCIWGAFLDAKRLVPLAFGWLFCCGVLSAVELGVLSVFLGPPNEVEVIVYMYLFNASQCAVVFGTLLIFRALGFRLLREPGNWSVPRPLKSDTNDKPPAADD